MKVLQLNGGSLHAERPGAPDATRCWLTALADRRAALEAQLQGLDRQEAGAEKLTDTRLHLVELAEAVAEQDAADLERFVERLDEYDAESERLLAETAGRVKSTRAHLEHTRAGCTRPGLGAWTPADRAAAEEELAAAERADGELLARRLSGREPLRLDWLSAARRGLATGLQFLALAESDMPDLAAARGRAREIRTELLELDRLANLVTYPDA